jgi:porphobilinogen synthase
MESTMLTETPTQNTTFTAELPYRPRRNRKSEGIRQLVQEHRLHTSDFVVPLFVIEGTNRIEEITSMPGIYRYTVDQLVKETERLMKLGIQAVDLFTVVPTELKTPDGSEAIRPNNLLHKSIEAIKKATPEMCVMVDVALDPYTSHGHDGVIDQNGNIINDETLMILMKMSLLASEFGADVIAPSDMMDGRVAYIRQALDSEGYTNVSICSYAAKYASAFYGPFREALESSPKFGDKKTYQMNPANILEALRESSLDEAEGADMLLVKPGISYLDVLTKIKDQTSLPVGIYHVSGEYSMVMAAAEKGWVDADRIFAETLLSMKRAGADFIFTYAASRIAPLL